MANLCDGGVCAGTRQIDSSLVCVVVACVQGQGKGGNSLVCVTVACVQAQGKGGNSFSLSGMKSKLFGGDTPEQREAKLKQLDEQIAQAELELKQTTEETQ